MLKQQSFVYRNIEFEPAYDLQTEKNRKELTHRVGTADLMKDFDYAGFCEAAKDTQPADLYRFFNGLFLPRERYSKLVSNYEEANDKVVIRVLSAAKHLEEPKTQFEKRFKIGFFWLYYQIWDCKESKCIGEFNSLVDAKSFLEKLKSDAK